MTVKVRVFIDRMEVSNKGKETSVAASESFTTDRLLVGKFLPAVKCLKHGLRLVQATGFLKRKPIIEITAMDKSDGGLSEVETRVLLEVAHAAGARRVGIENPPCA